MKAEITDLEFFEFYGGVLMKISTFAVKNTYNTSCMTTKVLYGCNRDLEGRISDCKLAKDAKCFDELSNMEDSVEIRNRRNKSICNGTFMPLLDRKKYVIATD